MGLEGWQQGRFETDCFYSNSVPFIQNNSHLYPIRKIKLGGIGMRISYTCFVQSHLTFFLILFFKIKKYLIFFHYIKINNENIIIFYNLFY